MPSDGDPTGFFQRLKSPNFVVMTETQRPKRRIAKNNWSFFVPGSKMQPVQFGQHGQKSVSRQLGQFQLFLIVVSGPFVFFPAATT